MRILTLLGLSLQGLITRRISARLIRDWEVGGGGISLELHDEFQPSPGESEVTLEKTGLRWSFFIENTMLLDVQVHFSIRAEISWL